MQDKEQEFINSLRHRFNSGVEELDRKTLADLAAVRARALERRPARFRTWFLVPAGSLAVLALALVVYQNLFSPATVRVPVEYDVQFMSAQEALDLYDDIEFYEWLADYDFPT